MRTLRLAPVVVVTALLLASVAACAPAATIDTTGATVIDVRTPAEYADGHLSGAVNIDFRNTSGFLAGVRQLDRDGNYVLYCRSGNRSAAAAARMRDLGFTNVTDAGGFENAQSATGLEVVR